MPDMQGHCPVEMSRDIRECFQNIGRWPLLMHHDASPLKNLIRHFFENGDILFLFIRDGPKFPVLIIP